MRARQGTTDALWPPMVIESATPWRRDGCVKRGDMRPRASATHAGRRSPGFNPAGRLLPIVVVVVVVLVSVSLRRAQQQQLPVFDGVHDRRRRW